MQLTVVLIREVWLWELAAYGFSKDKVGFRMVGVASKMGMCSSIAGAKKSRLLKHRVVFV